MLGEILSANLTRRTLIQGAGLLIAGNGAVDLESIHNRQQAIRDEYNAHHPPRSREEKIAIYNTLLLATAESIANPGDTSVMERPEVQNSLVAFDEEIGRDSAVSEKLESSGVGALSEIFPKLKIGVGLALIPFAEVVFPRTLRGDQGVSRQQQSTSPVNP